MLKVSIVLIIALISLIAFAEYSLIKLSQSHKITLVMNIESSAFTAGQFIPRRYSCIGFNSNPPLSFSAIPSGVKTFTLTVEDPDAPDGTFTHWIVYNIPVETTSIDESSVPAGASQGINSSGEATYEGPCPPSGTHHYVFTVYALDNAMQFANPPDIKTITTVMKGHIIAKGMLIGLFSK